MECGSLICY